MTAHTPGPGGIPIHNTAIDLQMLTSITSPPLIGSLPKPPGVAGADATPLRLRGDGGSPSISLPVNWANVMSTMQQYLVAPAPHVPSPVVLMSKPDDISTLPPIYNFDDIASNSYHLDAIGTPNALLQGTLKSFSFRSRC